MTSPLVNCIFSYAAVFATLSVHERYFSSLMLNDKLAVGDMPHLAVDQSEVRATQWSQIWSSGSGVA